MNIKFTYPTEGKNDHETTENLLTTVTLLIKRLEHILNNPDGYFLKGNNTSETEDYNG